MKQRIKIYRIHQNNTTRIIHSIKSSVYNKSMERCHIYKLIKYIQELKETRAIEPRISERELMTKIRVEINKAGTEKLIQRISETTS